MTNPSHNGSNGQNSQNWRSNKQTNDQRRGGAKPGQTHRNNNPNQSRSKTESKNQKCHNPDQKLQQKTGNAPKEDLVTKEEKIQLSQTLEAIMKRLSAMESRQTMYPHPGMNIHPPVQPLLSPAVPQPGTQTQYQWGSPNQWTQTQF